MIDHALATDASSHPRWKASFFAPPPGLPGPSLEAQVFMAALDRMDYPVLVVSAERQVWHANKAAASFLARGLVLRANDGCLQTCDKDDALKLSKAVIASTDRGLQSMVVLGRPGSPSLDIAVLPLPAVDGRGAALLLLGRRSIGEALSVEWYARAHRLTATEASVLKALCEGHSPNEIAAAHRVGIATVRSQINAVRQKTSSSSVRHLVDRIARLPPMTSLLPQ